MIFFDKLRLVPTIWRAMREAKKQGLSPDETERHDLQAGIHQSAKNDGENEASTEKFLDFFG